MGGTILFVHGTGVRFHDFQASFESLRAAAAAAGITADFRQCLWGDPLGVEFQGLSLPDDLSPEEKRRADAEDESWAWRFHDPLLELQQMAIDGRDQDALPSVMGPPEWQQRFDRLEVYSPSTDTVTLLERYGLADLWASAWGPLIADPIVPLALEKSAQANELADCEAALARAAIAMLHNAAIGLGRPAPSAVAREKLSVRLVADWGVVYGLGSALLKLVERAATATLRRKRNPFNRAIASQLGDILLYQSRGAEVRDFIRDAILEAPGPITVLAHSLGGIAVVDLLAMQPISSVANLVTVGSQSPYFYEIGALVSRKPPQPLPDSFPPWLNIFDRNDFLSFVGARVFGLQVKDFEIRSGQPFPASHSAYLTNEEAWRAIRDFIDA